MSERAALIMTVHRAGPDGCCQGCRAWWRLLVPHPCWQLRWALEFTGHRMTANYLTQGRPSTEPAPGRSTAAPGPGVRVSTRAAVAPPAG